MATTVDYLLFCGVSSLGYGMMMRAFHGNIVWIVMIADIVYTDCLQRCGYFTTQYRLSRVLVMFTIGMYGPCGVFISESVLCLVYTVLILVRDYMHSNNLINNKTEAWFTVLLVALYLIEAFDMLNHHEGLVSMLHPDYN